LSETKEIESADLVRGSSWIGWLPILVLPLTAIACGNLVPAWVFMWILSFAIFISLKWLTWWRARSQIAHSAWRSAAYLLAWPGMDAEAFLDASQYIPPPAPATWLWAIIETALGAILIWGLARFVPQEESLLRGWVGMLGIILFLHFGTFQIAALFWQRLGVDAKAIMSAPLRSTSLGEFWGKRWNLGFRQLSHELIFRPLRRRFGPDAAAFSVFIVSGLIHDLVISLPLRPIFRDAARLRIESAHVASRDSGEPDVPFSVSHQPVRSGIAGLERILFELSSLWIKPAKLVHALRRVPKRAVRARAQDRAGANAAWAGHIP